VEAITATRGCAYLGHGIDNPTSTRDLEQITKSPAGISRKPHSPQGCGFSLP
jgi:hypothetical protein